MDSRGPGPPFGHANALSCLFVETRLSIRQTTIPNGSDCLRDQTHHDHQDVLDVWLVAVICVTQQRPLNGYLLYNASLSHPAEKLSDCVSEITYNLPNEMRSSAGSLE